MRASLYRIWQYLERHWLMKIKEIFVTKFSSNYGESNSSFGQPLGVKSIVIVTLLTVSVDAQDLTKVEDKEPKFLNIKVKNPDLQLEIDKLKKEYERDFAELKAKHKQEKKSLKKSYRDRLKTMRREFRAKMKAKKN